MTWTTCPTRRGRRRSTLPFPTRSALAGPTGPSPSAGSERLRTFPYRGVARIAGT
ncbi:MAG: CRISPR-associated protein Cas5 [Gammaproteobacteria bacterium]|nr:CRISPR-associated protein Cas5 [Gammaproteobacteria bacterium]